MHSQSPSTIGRKHRKVIASALSALMMASASLGMSPVYAQAAPAATAEVEPNAAALKTLATAIVIPEEGPDDKWTLELLKAYEAAYGSIDRPVTAWSAAVRRTLVCTAIKNLDCMVDSLRVLDQTPGFNRSMIDRMVEVSRHNVKADAIEVRIENARQIVGFAMPDVAKKHAAAAAAAAAAPTAPAPAASGAPASVMPSPAPMPAPAPVTSALPSEEIAASAGQPSIWVTIGKVMIGLCAALLAAMGAYFGYRSYRRRSLPVAANVSPAANAAATAKLNVAAVLKEKAMSVMSPGVTPAVAAGIPAAQLSTFEPPSGYTQPSAPAPAWEPSAGAQADDADMGYPQHAAPVQEQPQASPVPQDGWYAAAKAPQQDNYVHPAQPQTEDTSHLQESAQWNAEPQPAEFDQPAQQAEWTPGTPDTNDMISPEQIATFNAAMSGLGVQPAGTEATHPADSPSVHNEQLPTASNQSKAISAHEMDAIHRTARRLLDSLHEADHDADTFMSHIDTSRLNDDQMRDLDVLQIWQESVRSLRRGVLESFAQQNFSTELNALETAESIDAALTKILAHAAYFSSMFQVHGRTDADIFKASTNIPYAVLSLYWSSTTRTHIRTLRDGPKIELPRIGNNKNSVTV